MTRFFIAFLTLALSGAVFSLPPTTQEQLGEVHTTASWSYSDCGMLMPLKSICAFNNTRLYRLAI